MCDSSIPDSPIRITKTGNQANVPIGVHRDVGTTFAFGAV